MQVNRHLQTLQAYLSQSHSRLYKLILLLLTILWLGSVLPALDYYPMVSGDDVWILSVSYKLWRENVFGSDMFAGFFQADKHYFINLPLHHVEQALLFHVVGVGIWQARLLSVLMTLALVWLVTSWVYRWYGGATAVLTAILFILWRSSLTGIGIPLLAVGRSGRYDIGAVWWMWVAIVLLVSWRERPSSLKAFGLGMSCGLAALTQFFGAFSFVLVFLLWLSWHKSQLLVRRDTYWLLAGVLLTIAPYLFFIVRHWSDFMGQRIITDGRLNLATLAFYGQNLRREPLRYAHLINLPGNTPAGYQAVSQWFLVLGMAPTAAHWWHRWRQSQSASDRIIFASLMVFGLCLLLWEQIKAPIYALVLLPTLCIMFAAAAVASLRWLWREGQSEWVKWGGTAVFTFLFAILVAEGLGTYAINWQRAQTPNNYQIVSEHLQSAVPTNAHVIGFEQWWWALRDRPTYLAWINLWQQWRWINLYQSEAVSLSELVAQTGATHLLLSRIDPIYIQQYPAAMQEQFNDLLAHCTEEVAHWEQAEYGVLTVYRLPRDETGQLICS